MTTAKQPSANNEKVILKGAIDFLGLGACGGNIVNGFEALGNNTLCINTSMEDLYSLKNTKYYYHLKSSEGAYKSREKAKSILRDNLDETIQVILNKLQADIIVTCFSMAGGTGSGIAPILCRILAEQFNKTIVPVAVLPNEDNESPIGCNNTIQCFRELERISSLGALFLLDNKKRTEESAINKEFISYFENFLTTYHSSTKGNFDLAEKKFLLSQSGYATLIKVSQDRTNDINIINAIKNNIYADREEDGLVKYVGMSLAKDNVSIKNILKETGEPPAHFVGYGSSATSIISVGMTYPATRLMEIQNKVKSNITNIQKCMSANSKLLFEEDVDPLSNIMSVASKPKKTTACDQSLVDSYFN